MRSARLSLTSGVLLSLALVSLPVFPAYAVPTASGENRVNAAVSEPAAGDWPTWAIESGSQFRLPPPPDQQATSAEIQQLAELATQRDAAALDEINYWDTGAPAFRWNNRTVQLLLSKGITVPRASRVMALLNVAIHDATVAAWDTKYTYHRTRPAEFRRGLVSPFRPRTAPPILPNMP
jgi:hypothetical protein